MAGSEDPDPLRDLGARIEAARRAQKPDSDAGEDMKAGSEAWRMVTELVAGVLVGGAMGWGLDGLFGTLPVFLLIFLALGFVAGIRVMLRTAGGMQRKPEADGDGEGTGDRARGQGSGGRR